MLPAGDVKPGAMDRPQASVYNVRQAALVGGVLQRDTLHPEGWITAVPENHQDHSSVPHPLWAEAVHLISYR